jgi:hypothetical protein
LLRAIQRGRQSLPTNPEEKGISKRKATALLEQAEEKNAISNRKATLLRAAKRGRQRQALEPPRPVHNVIAIIVLVVVLMIALALLVGFVATIFGFPATPSR